MCNTCDEKSNGKSNKRKRSNKKGQKCPENDEKTKKLPKCPKPKRPPLKAKKCLTRIEKIMLRIQPPIADRERYLHPEHVNCFLEESERIYSIRKPECMPCPSKRPNVCVEDDKKKKKKDKPIENVKGDNDEDQKMENGKEELAEPNYIKQDQKNVKEEKNEEEFERRNAKNQAKTSKKKKKKNKEKRKQVEADEERTDSEMSICSNDSEVCLVGLALTKEDKEKIEENRRKVHPPSDHGENSTESNKNAQELSIQEE